MELTLNEKLAVRFYARRVLYVIHRVFVSWRSWAFRYSYHRQLLLDNFVVNSYLAKRFYGWRWVARSRASLKLLLRRYWRRRIRHHFSWWKHGAKWLRVKQTLLPLTWRLLEQNVLFQRKITYRWSVLRQGLAAEVIQRKFFKYRLRKLFWAMKTINQFLKSRYFLKILILRRKREVSRQAAEQETINILLRRANSCLADMMSAEGGEVIVQQYVNSVKGVTAQVSRATPGSLLASAKVFPDNRDAPEFARLWTVRAKAMEVLKRRATYTVTYSARTRFRFSYPPPYACGHCARPFLMKAEYVSHRQSGCLGPRSEKKRQNPSPLEAVTQRGVTMVRSLKKSVGPPDRFGRSPTGLGEDEEVSVESEPSYVCWTLAEPIVSAALRPIADYLIIPQAQVPAQQHQQQQAQSRGQRQHQMLEPRTVGPEHDLDSDASNEETEESAEEDDDGESGSRGELSC